MCVHRCRLSHRFLLFTVSSALLAFGLTLGATSYAFVRLRTGANGLFWPGAQSGPISFVINDQSVPGGVTAGQFRAAVRSGFARWQAVSESGIRFEEDTNPAHNGRTDYTAGDTHLVFFDGNNSSGFFGNSGLVAVTPVSFLTDGRIQDADIIVNSRDHSFAVDGRPGAFDVQSVVTHEIGHFIGLDHSCVGNTTMMPFAFQGEVLQRSLEEDDRIAASVVYPGFGAAGATVAGRVLDDNSNAVRGAHVVAVRQDGRVATSTLSGNNGTFRIDGLDPADVYSIYIEPVDGPVVADNLSTGISGQQVDIEFGTTVYGGFGSPTDIVLSSGVTTDLGDITVRDRAQPQKMNLRGISRNSVERGSSATITLTTDGLRSTDDFSCSSPDVALSAITVSGAFGTVVTMRVSPSASMLPGIYSIRVHRASTGDTAILTGGLEIRDPAPAVESLSSSQVDAAGEALQIFGAEFKDGARVVVHDTPVESVTVLNSGQLNFVTPVLEPGRYDVVVLNPDGQESRLSQALDVVGTAPPPAPTPAPAPAPAAGGGGGGGGGGCSVSPAATTPMDGLGGILPLLLLLMLGLRVRRV